ncbi:hypothetical protein JTB14_002150 [Gonioctena quinquepunctata]|nr:hypothetical protein JTB14_002150 [Gonioctena quinquepunctata]
MGGCKPDKSKIKSVERKLRGTIPTAASSLEWQHHHRRKEETKELQEKAKEDETKIIEKISSKPETTKTSKQELKSDSIVEVGEYCIVNYNGSQFAGGVSDENPRERL